MKNSIMTLAALATMLNAPAQATTLNSQVDEALQSLIVLTETDKATAADVDRVGHLIANFEDPFAPDPDDALVVQLRSRLMLHVQSLIFRAQNAYLSLQDAYDLQEELVDARLDFAIAQLEERLKNGGGSQKQFERAVAMLHQRADAAVGDPNAEAIRAALMEAFYQAIGRAEISATGTSVPATVDFQPFRLALIRARLTRALESLERRAKNGGATREDYMRVVNLYVDRAQAAAEMTE